MFLDIVRISTQIMNKLLRVNDMKVNKPHNQMQESIPTTSKL